MFDFFDEIIHLIIWSLVLVLCFIIAVFRWAVEIWNTILSSPPLLAFVIVGSLVILWGVRKFAVWQKTTLRNIRSGGDDRTLFARINFLKE